MSELKVNKVTPRSGTTVTLGDSGDTITVPTGVTTTLTDGVSGDFKMNSGYGSVATAYGCRAWVNFNGTGTVAINDSANISSVTDTNVGIYEANFTNAMPDANYTVAGLCRETNTGGDGFMRLSSTYSVNATRILCVENTANNNIDCEKIVLTFFR